MNYVGIQKSSLVNGEGVRVVLWVSGCEHRCKGCQNQFAWDPDSGEPFDEEDEKELMLAVKRNFIDGLTLSGGDPMFPANRDEIARICKAVKEETGKSIWMYTGYKMEEISNEKVLKYLDVIVDGEFIEELKDDSYMWAGSTNQRIWRNVNGRWTTRENSTEL